MALKLENNLGTNFNLTHANNAGEISLTSKDLTSTAYTIEAIEDLITVPVEFNTVIVKDINRGGTFVSKTEVDIDPNTGSLYAVNGGTVFAKLGGGFWVRQYSGAVNVKWFGAVTSSTINTAISIVHSNGGGLVFIEAGTYMLNKINSTQAIVMLDNVTLFGEGRGATTLFLNNAQNVHLISFVDATNANVKNLTLDGNRTNQTASAHGIRVNGGSNLTFSELNILNIAGYGIGLQGGTMSYCKILNVFINGTGRDGIDVKNTNDNNTSNIIDGAIIKNHGLSEIGQTGIDIRGEGWIVNNVSVTEYGENSTGVRVRSGELADTNGLGGHFSILSNIFCKASTTTLTNGIISEARFVNISNCIVENTRIAYRFDQEHCQASNCTSYNAGEIAFQTRGDTGLPTKADYTHFSNCKAYGGAIGFAFGGIGTIHRTCFVYNNSGADFTGFLTEQNLESAAFSITAVATKNISVPHNLDRAPDIKDCQISVSSMYTDWGCRYFAIQSTTSTHIVCSVVVDRAESTVGATARFILKVSTVKSY